MRAAPVTRVPAVPRLLALALLALAALAGGCASGRVKEANRYVAAVNKAQTRFAQGSERLLARISPTSSAVQDRRTLARFYAVVDGFAGRLREIAPPARVRPQHRRLIAAVERFSTSLRAAGADITARDAGRILDGQQELAKATARVTSAINETVVAINRALKG